jgi:UDP-N-acetylmuramoyl-L-alanyl-D-glutamate--2,6-diaminopimelate ligase
MIGVGRAGETLRLLERGARGLLAAPLHCGRQAGELEVVLPLVGDFMAGNALVAAGLAIAAGEDAEAALQAISGLHGVAGRLERVGEVNGRARRRRLCP